MPKGNKGQQVILENRVCLDPLGIWDPKDLKESQGTRVFQALKVRQVWLGLQAPPGLEEQGVHLG